MPDERRHRGAHPADARLFSADAVPVLRTATAELSWLLSRDYSLDASLKLVGDRYSLRERQRLAVRRAACSDQDRASREGSRRPVGELRGRLVVIDGFNLIITVEAALSGGALLVCRDGTIRDLASIHGSYRSVEETEKAIRMIGETLSALGTASARWFFDSPVSNSGRLAARVCEIAESNRWNWTAAAMFNPDREIVAAGGIVITADSTILDQKVAWVPLVEHLIDQRLPDAWRLDLRS